MFRGFLSQKSFSIGLILAILSMDSPLTLASPTLASPTLASPNVPIAQETSKKQPLVNDDWVNHVAPGIRLVGRPNTAALHLDSILFTMSPDGKLLVGCRGRSLVVIDWDAQRFVREIVLPTRAGSSGVRALAFTQDGQHLLVLINWSGRPYEADDGTDLDDEDYLQYYQKYPPHKFRGSRFLVYNQAWKLQHDLELVTQVDQRERVIGQVGSEDFTDIKLLPDDQTALAIGGPTAKVIDIVNGKVIAEQSKLSSGWLVSDHELAFGRPLKIWNIHENSVQPADKLGLPEHAILQAVDQKLEQMVYYDPSAKETKLLNRKTGNRKTLKTGSIMSYGQFTSDGRLYIFSEQVVVDSVFQGIVLHVYDTVHEDFMIQAKSESPSWLTFRPGHHSLLVRSVHDASISEIEIDKDLVASLKQATSRLPTKGRITYTDSDRKIVFQDGACLLETDEDATVSRFWYHGGVFSPIKAIQVSRKADSSEHEIGTSGLTSEKFKTLYKIAPSQAMHSLKSILGIHSQQRPKIQAVYLGFDPNGEVIRDLYVENGSILRLRLSDPESGRKIFETRLHTQLKPTVQAKGTVSPDGQRVAIAEQQKVEVLDVKTGEILREWNAPQPVRQVVLDRRGEYVAVALAKRSWLSTNQINVYRVSDGEEVFSERGRGMSSFGFQPGTDRFYVLTSEKENELRFFDRDHWTVAWRHATAYAPAYDMAMSSTGQEIAIGLRDSRVEFWKLSELNR